MKNAVNEYVTSGNVFVIIAGFGINLLWILSMLYGYEHGERSHIIK